MVAPRDMEIMSKTLKISVIKLKHALTKNRESHKAAYEKAVEGWNIDYQQEVDNYVKAVEVWSTKLDPEDPNRHRMESMPSFRPPRRPEHHLDDYDRMLTVIDMLSDGEQTMEMSVEEIDRYVRDEWSWKHDFFATTSKYIG